MEDTRMEPREILDVSIEEAGMSPAELARRQVELERREERAQREELARAALEPLGAHERPWPLLVAVAVALVLSIAVIAGALTVHHLSSRGGSLPGAIFIAALLGLLARGMYARRYWAVLGFEALLAFQILVTSLALVVASTILAAGICLMSIGLGGWLFWKLVRVMGRIQAGEQRERAARS
jgi:hypothetical protein